MRLGRHPAHYQYQKYQQNQHHDLDQLMLNTHHSLAAIPQQGEDPLAAPVTSWQLSHHGIDFGMFEKSHVARAVRTLIRL